MGLTTHQQEKLDEALEILKTQKRLLIKGSAGVGKTFLVDTLIKSLIPSLSKYKAIYCSAPTNKAVSVIKEKVTPHHNIEFITVHSALKLRRQINNKTGATYFKPSFDQRYPPLDGVSLMVIDEASMLNLELTRYIEEYASRFGVIVIFVGDDKQLNPVGEEDSTVFLGKPIIDPLTDEVIEYEPYPEVELTEIVRQGEGNPIIHLSRNLYEIKLKENNFISKDEGGLEGFIHSGNGEKIINELALVNGTDAIKYLAWTNAEVDRINFLVRRKIYGTPGKIEVGETLVFNAPYDDFFTNEEILVEKTQVMEYPFQYICKENKATGETTTSETILKVYCINGLDKDKPTGVLVIHEDSEERFKLLLKDLKNRAKFGDIGWVTYFKFAESFADLKYNHAITVHKSQGSTYGTAVVNIGNLLINKNAKERERLLYTAVTRPSKLLILYNS